VANQPIADDGASECVCYFLIKKRQDEKREGGDNEKKEGGMARTKRDKS
jgi:hypothetical protein